MMRAKSASVVGIAVVGLALAVGQSAWAEDTSSGTGFGNALSADDLAQARAGDVSVIVSNPSQTAEQHGNTIEGDAPSGSVFIPDGAMNGLHGIGQIVVNSAAHGIAQGNVTMNLILNPPPAEP